MPSGYFEGAFYLWCKSVNKDPTSVNLKPGIEVRITCTVSVLELVCIFLKFQWLPIYCHLKETIKVCFP